MRQWKWLIVVLVPGCTSMVPGDAGETSGGRATGPAAVTVLVAPEVRAGWSFLYRYVNAAEFVLCLEGEQVGEIVHIRDFRLAPLRGGGAHGDEALCSGPRFIGTAHSHRAGTADSPCLPTAADDRNLQRDPRALVDVILCGRERYVWTLRDGTRGGPGHASRP